jgi:hypothetical protein
MSPLFRARRILICFYFLLIVEVVIARPPLLPGPGELLSGLLVHLSSISPGTAGRSSEKSLKFLGETSDYADFTARNPEDLPDRTTDYASACTKPK